MARAKVIHQNLWPAADREAWAAALAEGDIFDGRGPGAHWSAATKRNVASDYGRWIRYLEETNPGALALPPDDRVTREHVRAYVARLEADVAPAGACNSLSHLYDAIRVMAPDRDWTWLRAVARSLKARVIPRAKRDRMVDPERLLDLAVRLMEEAEVDLSGLSLAAPLRYRDGLIIGFLTLRPIRRRNLAAMRLDHNLVRAGSSWQVAFEPEETKNRQPLEFPFPEVLLACLERYLSEVRPRFPGAAEHDGLWASAKGGPMTKTAIYAQVAKRTKAAFGKAINLHLFRDIAVTAIAIKDPANIARARDLLGHSDLKTLDRHYNQASQIEAARSYHETILVLRRNPQHPVRTRIKGS